MYEWLLSLKAQSRICHYKIPGDFYVYEALCFNVYYRSRHSYFVELTLLSVTRQTKSHCR